MAAATPTPSAIMVPEIPLTTLKLPPLNEESGFVPDVPPVRLIGGISPAIIYLRFIISAVPSKRSEPAPRPTQTSGFMAVALAVVAFSLARA